MKHKLVPATHLLVDNTITFHHAFRWGRVIHPKNITFPKSCCVRLNFLVAKCHLFTLFTKLMIFFLHERRHLMPPVSNEGQLCVCSLYLHPIRLAAWHARVTRWVIRNRSQHKDMRDMRGATLCAMRWWSLLQDWGAVQTSCCPFLVNFATFYFPILNFKSMPFKNYQIYEKNEGTCFFTKGWTF